MVVGNAKRWMVMTWRDTVDWQLGDFPHPCPSPRGRGVHVLVSDGWSDDFEIALQFPVGDAVEPLPPLPLAGGGEMIDEVVAEPVARDFRVLEIAGRLDQRPRCARNILGALVGAVDRFRG